MYAPGIIQMTYGWPIATLVVYCINCTSDSKSDRLIKSKHYVWRHLITSIRSELLLKLAGEAEGDVKFQFGSNICKDATDIHHTSETSIFEFSFYTFSCKIEKFT